MAAARKNDPQDQNRDKSGEMATGKSEENGFAGNGTSGKGAQTDPLQLLRSQHGDLKRLLAGDRADPEEFLRLWGPRATAEDDVLDPAIRRTSSGEELLSEAAVRRDMIRVLLGAALAANEDDPTRGAIIRVLSGEFNTLMTLEERPGTGLLALAQKADIDSDELRECLQPGEADDQQELRAWLRPQTIHISKNFMRGRRDRQEEQMARGSWMRDRDDEGRFMSDDRDYGRRSRTPDRDEYGRFVSDDDGRSYGRSRDYDDDRGYRGSRNGDYERSGSGRGHGGWYGDPEGHAEAARRGWDEREGGGRGQDDDRDYGRRYGRDRDEYGRFMSEDDRRYSRSRYEDDERRGSGRGHGGWYGDPEGHSEASRRGWDERRDEDRGYRSRSSSYDDDRRGSGRGHGGWYGDPEGHSEASRRGWDDRR